MVTRQKFLSTQYVYESKSFTTGNSLKWNPPVTTTYSYTCETEAITSVTTPNYWRRKTVRSVYVPRKGHLLKEPRLPVLRLPRRPIEPYLAPFKVLRPPQPYKGTDKVKQAKSRILLEAFTRKEVARRKTYDARLRSLLRIYHTKVKKYKAIVEKRRADYAKATERYNRKRRFFEQQQLWMKEGKLSYKRVRNTLPLQNNPYTKTSITMTPIMGEYKTTLYYKDNGNDTHSPATSPSAADLTAERWLSGAVEAFLPRSITPDANAKSSALASAESRALSKVYDKLKSDHVHVGNIIAERAQTIKLIADIIKAVKNPLLAAKRANLKTISDNLLAFQFGIRPLLNDAYSAGTQLAKILDSEKSDRIMVYASSSGNCQSTSKTPTFSSGFKIYDTFVEANYQAEVRYVLEYKISNAPLNQLQALGLVNPAEIAWEVMPWSFVVDWFLPLGNWLANLNADAGLTFVTGTKSVVTTDTYSIAKVGSYGFNVSESNSRQIRAFGSETRRTKTRTVLTSRPVVPFPEFKSPVSFYHIAESLALLVQRLR